MPLPADWVNSLFTRLSVRYGSEWARKWEGLDSAAVKADWAEELSGFVANPDAIKRALGNLPERVPTVTQFRALCIGAPGDVHEKTLRLAAPSVSPEVVAAAKAVARGPKSDVDPKAWAWRLKAREETGASMPAAHRAMWRAALAGLDGIERPHDFPQP